MRYLYATLKNMFWQPFSLLSILFACNMLTMSVMTHAEENIKDMDKQPTASMHEQILSIPGDPTRPVTLQTTLFEPPGNGPFPLAVMNHGAKGEPRSVERYRLSFSIDYLLSRGYAVIAPMMRGYAESGGQAVSTGCDYARIAILNAHDIQAVIDFAKQRTEIDGSRIVVMGQSFGGWNSLGYATMASPGVKGIINVVGGMKSSDCAQPERAMSEASEKFGHAAKVPSLWFYGENDHLFPEKIWRNTFMRYTQAGGRAELVDIGSMDDAHNLLGHGEWLGLWIPKVDAFFAQIGLPNANIYPEYLPLLSPPKSNYAELTDTRSVPFIGSNNPDFYQKFFLKEKPRVLVISPKFASLESGGFDPLARAMNDCQKHSERCMPYAYNDDVVWAGPMPGESYKINGIVIYGKLAHPAMINTVQKFVSLSSDCTPMSLPDVQINQQPAHGTAAIETTKGRPTFAAQDPHAACNDKEVPMERITYLPKADFKGTDFISIVMTEAGRPPQIIKLAVLVK